MTIGFEENILSDRETSSLDWNIRDDFKGLSLEEIQEIQQQCYPYRYAIAMINTSGSLNIGVAIRSSVLFGCREFFIVGRRKYDKRSTVGAHNYIKLNRIEGDAWIDDIQKEYSPVLIETEGTAIQAANLSSQLFADKPPCFIFGEEQAGIPQSIIDMGFPMFSIHTPGVMRSLNVSVAVSVLAYELSKYAPSTY